MAAETTDELVAVSQARESIVTKWWKIYNYLNIVWSSNNHGIMEFWNSCFSFIQFIKFTYVRKFFSTRVNFFNALILLDANLTALIVMNRDVVMRYRLWTSTCWRTWRSLDSGMMTWSINWLRTMDQSRYATSTAFHCSWFTYAVFCTRNMKPWMCYDFNRQHSEINDCLEDNRENY